MPIKAETIATKGGRTAPFFALMDTLRRTQADALGTLGLGPSECDYRILASGSCWRLRGYLGPAGQPVLLVPAPIKRPYIWDLTPSASAVRYCLRHRLRVCLIEWIPPPHADGTNGLDEYIDAISECIARVSNEAPGTKPFLIGHSLGGTLAAIFAAAAPESIRGLVLLGAPLCFQPATSRFWDAIAALTPSPLSELDVIPGSFLSQVSAWASPHTFIWSRLTDAALSIVDSEAMDIHARVERWALDEAALPGKLVYQLVQWLCRENRLCRGTLLVRGKAVGPFSLRIPTLAIVNTHDEIAPRASVAPFFDAMPSKDGRLIEYPAEPGVALQHLGILVGRQAYAKIWPEIISWLELRP